MPGVSPFLTRLTTALLLCTASVAGQQSSGGSAVASPPPAEYQIGPEDVLDVVFWREKELSGAVTVRPDGIITIPLIGEIQTGGKTPPLVAAEIQKLAERYLTNPIVSVGLRQMNSRKIYVTGEVNASGAYPLTGVLTVMQAISLAGGVREFARLDAITILREEAGRTRALSVNYDEISRGRRLEQNYQLQPGDTVVVP
jgi:polysaccharide export outer membrane protein